MWIVPFRGRNHSGCYQQNFLWNKDNIYIMDNHRAALWCWFQHLEPTLKYGYFHIDKHSDALRSRLDEWVGLCPDMFNVNIDDYLDKVYRIDTVGGEIPLFRWDNYASIFLAKYGAMISRCMFATHGVGDDPVHGSVQNYNIWDLPGNMNYWLEDEPEQWIVNIDLDYFFYKSDFNSFEYLVSDDYLEQLFSAIKLQLNNGRLASLTICLSPECCGGWEASEKICSKVVELLDIEFELPE